MADKPHRLILTTSVASLVVSCFSFGVSLYSAHQAVIGMHAAQRAYLSFAFDRVRNPHIDTRAGCVLMMAADIIIKNLGNTPATNVETNAADPGRLLRTAYSPIRPPDRIDISPKDSAFIGGLIGLPFSGSRELASAFQQGESRAVPISGNYTDVFGERHYFSETLSFRLLLLSKDQQKEVVKTANTQCSTR